MEEGRYGYDMGLLWAAYKVGSFPLIDRQDMNEGEFAEFIVGVARGLSSALMVEDDCSRYASGRGPVAFIGIRSDGWRVEPHVDYFKWAAPRTMLRTTVAFFQMARYSKDVGTCVVNSLKNTENLFNHVIGYGVLYAVGKIPKGSPRGDVYLYSIAGKKDIREPEAMAA